MSVKVKRIPEGVSGIRPLLCDECGGDIEGEHVQRYLGDYNALPDRCAECDKDLMDIEPYRCPLCLEVLEHEHICGFCAEVYAVCVVSGPGYRCACGNIIHRVDMTACTDCGGAPS